MNLQKYFVGFDAPKLNESAIELSKDGELYVSSYHHCRVTEFAFEHGGGFVVTLKQITEAYENPESPKKGSVIKLILHDAVVRKIE